MDQADKVRQHREEKVLRRNLFKAKTAGEVSEALYNGADVDWQDRHGQTVLIKNALNQIDTVRVLLEAQADTDIQDAQGNTALMWAVKGNSLQIVKLLLEYNAYPDIENKVGETALSIAEKYNYTEVINCLLAILQ